jgi:hypothetical protein
VFDAQDDCYLEIKATPIGTQCGLLTAKSDFWDQVVNFSGCSSSINALQNAGIYHKFSVFPNPAKDFIFINSHASDIEVFIFDMSGKLLKHLKNSSVVNISDLSEGIYIVRILSVDNQLHTEKLIKFK